jgi:hypothetical protein
MLVEIDVAKEGVGGAKNFFEAKVCMSFFRNICIYHIDFM